MRIALCPSSYAPHVGGVEEHVRNLATQLVARGHAVEVWAPSVGSLSLSEDIESIPVSRLPIPLPAFRPRSIAGFLGAYLPARTAWRNQVERFQPDIVNVHCFGPNGIYASNAARAAGLPLVISLHGETFMDDGRLFEDSVVMNRGLRLALRRADLVTGCSQITLDDAHERFGLPAGQGTVVFNGVDLHESRGDTAAQTPTDWRNYLLAVGRMVHNKGFDLLVDAFAEIADRHPDVDLMIGGSGPALDALRSQAEALGLGSRLIFPGRLDRAGVGNAMASAAAFIMPSRVEPFGIVILEGWRASVPVIASSCGGPPEFVNDGVDGLLVDPHDRDSLARVIDLVLSDTDLAARLAAAGRRRVESFAWTRVAAQYEGLFQGIAG